MYSLLTKKSGPKRILVISQTNIGDVVLTCPVIDILRRDFPAAEMEVIVGPKAVSLFEGNPAFKVNVFEKRAPLRRQLAWFSQLSSRHFDCVVDLRHTMLPLFLMPRYSTPLVYKKSFPGHKKDAHLSRLRQLYDFGPATAEKIAIVNTREDQRFFEADLAPFLEGRDFLVIAAGAADSAKRWHTKGFAQAADYLSASFKIVFVGDAKDAVIIDEIQGRMNAKTLSLAGKISLRQLGFVLKKSSFGLVHDSGVMHLASYLNVPLVALWGPTNFVKYAPWSDKSQVVRRNEKCIRCQQGKSEIAHTCMSSIEVDDVLKAVNALRR